MARTQLRFFTAERFVLLPPPGGFSLPERYIMATEITLFRQAASGLQSHEALIDPIASYAATFSRRRNNLVRRKIRHKIKLALRFIGRDSQS
jgi:hypothetical protein